MELKTLKKTEQLKVVKNGTSLQVTIPASFVKEANLKPGDPLTVTFEASLMKVKASFINSINKLVRDLHREIPAFKPYGADEVLQILIMKYNNTGLKVGEQLERAISQSGEVDYQMTDTIAAYQVLKKNEEKFNEVLREQYQKKGAR